MFQKTTLPVDSFCRWILNRPKKIYIIVIKQDKDMTANNLWEEKERFAQFAFATKKVSDQIVVLGTLQSPVSESGGGDSW